MGVSASREGERVSRQLPLLPLSQGEPRSESGRDLPKVTQHVNYRTGDFDSGGLSPSPVLFASPSLRLAKLTEARLLRCRPMVMAR